MDLTPGGSAGSTAAGGDDPRPGTARRDIAIVGIGCRFPGGIAGPDAYWDFLRVAGDAVREVPPDRWSVRRFLAADSRAPGAMPVGRGAFLAEPLDRMDAPFFGVSPREAAQMDPQQRLLLEVAWEALEDAALAPDRLRGSPTGVFVGGFNLDNFLHQYGSLNRDAADTYSASGSTMTMLAARLSYFFDFTGPALAVDTACSSSLVATHLACQSLLAGECSLALAGGVNVMFKPETTIVMAKGGFLSPDGRSKAFGVGANGYGRGEGAGVVVLKPLDRALADGDPVWAVIRGTAANQDGHSVGITVPNVEAQKAVARAACARARVSPGAIGYVEAHGTGTPVGDAAEVSSLAAVMAEGRGEGDRCWVGSVKPNIGHLEAAAGVAGLIKAALVLDRGEVPPHLAGLRENPELGMGETCLRLPRSPEPLVRDGAALAAVNSFGYGGTNAHVVLGEAPAAAPAEPSVDGPVLLPLSAKSDEALRQVADRLADHLVDSPASLGDVAATAAVGRAALEHRLAVVSDSREDALAQLRTFAGGEAVGALSGRARERRVAFVYTGMGPQWWAMGWELLAEDPVFREAMEQCDAGFRARGGYSLLEILASPSEAESRIQETHITQAAIFGVQVGLTARLEAWGIRPDVVVGHSVGEVAAAWAAGGLDLDDALTLSFHRGRLQGTMAGPGRMLATGLTESAASELVARSGGGAEIAAVNAPTDVTLTGDGPALEAIAEELERREVFCRLLKVEIAAHSRQMDPIEEELRRELEVIRPRAGHRPLVSTVTGSRLPTEALDGEYWWRNVRRAVRFADAVAALVAEGVDTFVEVGPHPVLARALNVCLRERDGGAGHAVTVATLRRGEPERASLLRTAGGLFACGVPVDWTALRPVRGRRLRLPTYPWQRERHWQETPAEREDRLGPVGHPLLGVRQRHPLDSREVTLSEGLQPYLADHRVQGATVFPGAGYVEVGLALAAESRPDGAVAVEDVRFHEALLLDQDRPVRLFVVDEEGGGYRVFSRAVADDAPFVLRASGRRGAAAALPDVSLAQVRERCTEELASAEVYERLRMRGLEYGPAFQGVERLWVGEGEVLAEIRLPASAGTGDEAYVIHPVLLDAALHAALFAVPGGALYLPVALDRLTRVGPPGSRFLVHARLVRAGRREAVLDLRLCDDEGRVAVAVNGLSCREIAVAAPRRVGEDLLYGIAWEREEPGPLPEEEDAGGAWLVLGDRGGVGRELAGLLEALGHRCELVEEGPGDGNGAGAAGGPLDRERLAGLLGAEPLRGVVHLRALDTPSVDALDLAALKASRTGTCTSVATLAQAMAARDGTAPPRVWLVTRGAQPVGEAAVTGLAQAPLIGLARCWANEDPEVRPTLVDLDPAPSASGAFQLLTEILVGSAESEVAFRGESRWVSRLARLEPDALASPRRVRPSDVPVEFLDPTRTGGPSFRVVAPDTPGDGEVELDVRALGLTSGAPAAHSNGSGGGAWRDGAVDCAGVVRAVGPGAPFRPGQAVYARVDGRAASRLVVAAERVVAAPDAWSHEEAVSLGAYARAAFAVLDVAGLREGERLLIRGGSDPAAAAGVLLARQAGARAVALVPSAAERRRLEDLDAAVVAGSDGVAPWDAVLARLGGTADVVVGTDGEDPSHGPPPLPPLARIVDLAGGPARAPDRDHLPPGARLGRADLDALFAARPDLGADLLRRVVALVGEGALPPLPARTVAPRDLGAGLRSEAGADSPRVLVLSDLDEVEVAPDSDGPLFRPDGTYLVTGGLGGFGLEICRWMVSRGARHLAIVSRRSTPGAALPAIEAMRADAARVETYSADVTDPDAVADVLARVRTSLPPLRGVIHGAMVLDDDYLARLDDARFRRVLAPKVWGAWNLEVLTREHDLDLFLMLSSVSTLVGNPGQANYDAANAFLDALAHHRSARGAPGLSINLGAIGGVGTVAQDAEVEAALRRTGIEPVDVQDVLATMEWLLRQGVSRQVGLMRIDWGRLFQAYPALGRQPRLQGLAGPAAAPAAARGGAWAAVLGAPEAERGPLLQDWLRQRMVRIMGVTSGEFPVDRSLSELGLDSMMASELAAVLEQELAVSIPMVRLLQGPTLEQLATQLVRQASPARASDA